MSLAAFALAQQAIAQPSGTYPSKPPPKRSVAATSDAVLVPEAR